MRIMNSRSLENLKLGGQSRRKGKIRRTYTLLPETVEWLSQTGNASNSIDELVRSRSGRSAKIDSLQLGSTMGSFNQTVMALQVIGLELEGIFSEAILSESHQVKEADPIARSHPQQNQVPVKPAGFSSGFAKPNKKRRK